MTVRRPPTRVGGALSSVGLVGAVGLAGVLVLGGCTGFAGTSAPATTSSVPSSAPSSATTASTTAATTAAAVELPATCTDLLSTAQLDAALGARLPGTSTYVVGLPEPSIGRTGRVTCGFGVTPATATAGASDPLLEVSLLTYTDPGAATDRVAAVVAARQGQGVTAGSATVPGAQAVLFAGAADTTLVATLAERTVSLTLVPGLLDAAATRAALEQLAAAALGAGTGTSVGSEARTTTSPQTGRPAGTSTSSATG
ncbi:hypothetical protein TEK04_04250 [Klenkia sp. LSe6-5]|uniref:DUF3558 domain-containing protein n=1 Tax=Klenkia sesuvii TaxID=3103137 RepID=A0ABU8DQ50_9ACTN